NIQITLSESLGVEDRAGYYETAGALRDMVQNHILQIVSLLTMNAPVTFTDVDIRREKISALKALQLYTPEEVKKYFVRGQYAHTEDLNGYREEDQVDPNSTTETFVAGKLHVNSMNFAGVPIYIRTGKRLAAKSTRVDVVFKNMPNNIFNANKKLLPIVLSFDIDAIPGMSLTLNTNKLYKTGYKSENIELKFHHVIYIQEIIPEAYQNLIVDAVKGDSINFVLWEEFYYSWGFIVDVR